MTEGWRLSSARLEPYDSFECARAGGTLSTRGTGQTFEHWLPATFIANFSFDASRASRRDRPVWVRDRRAANAYVAACKDIAGKAAFYRLLTVEPARSGAIDRTWAYEAKLADAIQHLVEVKDDLDALEWLSVLVPFAAGLLARGPDFNQRLRLRKRRGGHPYYITTAPLIDGNELDQSPPAAPQTPDEFSDAITRARVIELQRLLVPVMAARWVIGHAPEGHDLITSDHGYVPATVPSVSCTGATVPLTPRAALFLVPYRTRDIIEGQLFQGWRAPIHHHQLTAADVREVNVTAARTCTQRIIGSTPESVDSMIAALAMEPIPLTDSPFITTFQRDVLQAAETDWFRLCSAIKRYHPGDSRVSTFPLDPKQVGEDGFMGMIMLTADRPESPFAISLHEYRGTIRISIPHVLFRREDRGTAFISVPGISVRPEEQVWLPSRALGNVAIQYNSA